MEIRKRLEQEAEEKYRVFSSALIPNIDNVLGVRIPKLNKLVKELYKTDWKPFLNQPCIYMEETMLQGILIAKSEDLELIKQFVPKINNWAVCDKFCNSLKCVRKKKQLYWKLIQPYLNSNDEFLNRFALVILLEYFIERDYLKNIFDILNKFQSKEYYAQMAAAWLVSMCFVEYPTETTEFLKTTKLDDWTYNKSIQKIIESLKVDKPTKQKLKLMKR